MFISSNQALYYWELVNYLKTNLSCFGRHRLLQNANFRFLGREKEVLPILRMMYNISTSVFLRNLNWKWYFNWTILKELAEKNKIKQFKWLYNFLVPVESIITYTINMYHLLKTNTLIIDFCLFQLSKFSFVFIYVFNLYTSCQMRSR